MELHAIHVELMLPLVPPPLLLLPAQLDMSCLIITVMLANQTLLPVLLHLLLLLDHLLVLQDISLPQNTLVLHVPSQLNFLLKLEDNLLIKLKLLHAQLKDLLNSPKLLQLLVIMDLLLIKIQPEK